MTHKVELYTDGGCVLPEGVGGWGVVVRVDGEDAIDLSGGATETTNNRMEMMAAIAALEALSRPCVIELWTDSSYLKGGITGWIHGWKKNGWKTADKKPVKNAELWQRLDELRLKHDISWHWVKGHAGHPENERADALARQGIVVEKKKEDL